MKFRQVMSIASVVCLLSGSVQAATITLEQFPTALDAAQLNRVSELMQEAGLIRSPVQASSLMNG